MHFASLALSIVTFAPAPQDAQLLLVDRVQVIVNDEILTYRQVMGTTVRSLAKGEILTKTELEERAGQVGQKLINERLQVQGGIDMGMEEEAVMRNVYSHTDRLVGSAGGFIQMADNLNDSGISLLDEEKKNRRSLYRFSWDRAITGLNVGVSGRAYRDRYVRPGQIKLRYDLLDQGKPGAEAIQGISTHYHLQKLTFPTKQGEKEIETTWGRANEVRKSLLDGLDFTTAVRGSADPGKDDGRLLPMTSMELARNDGLEVAAFAISAKVEEISRPMPILHGRSIRGWRLMKLIDTDAPLLPLFEAPKTQAMLRQVIQADNDDYLRSEGLESLNQGAYIWFSGGVED